MKHREDVAVLEKLIGLRALHKEDVEEMLKLPLIIIPNPVSGKYPEWEKFVSTDWAAPFLPEQELPLLDFMVMLDYRDQVYPAGTREAGLPIGSTYARFTQIDANTVRVAYTSYPQTRGIPHWWTTAILSGYSANMLKYSEITRSGTFVQLLQEAERKDPATRDRANDQVTKRLAEIYGHVSCFARFNNQQDRYLFSVTRNGKRKFANNREGQLARVAGPRIIYLDKLPTPANHSEEFTGRTVASHQRRGHFKTLRAERYKQHPLYQVEKGIYIKPTWVGDRSTVVNGATYKLMERTGVVDL